MTIISPKRVVVLGGSFNPPTMAHMRLLQAALDGLHAELGVFVPSSHGYVRRKMKRTPYPDEVLPDSLRLDMLNAMCADDIRLTVNDTELATTNGAGYTYETMCLVQRQYPEAELYFIFGADKLNGLPRWRTYEPFVRDFRLLIFSRDEFDPKGIFENNPQLNAHRDAFVFLPQPEGTEDVSSTAVRALMRDGEDASHMLHPEAARILTQFRR